jgi:hypothetical protein
LVPPQRVRAVTLQLPSIADGSCGSTAAALAAVLDAMAAGQVDPAEAAMIADLIERTGEALQNCGGMPRKLTKAEKAWAKNHPAPAWPMLKL